MKKKATPSGYRMLWQKVPSLKHLAHRIKFLGNSGVGKMTVVYCVAFSHGNLAVLTLLSRVSMQSCRARYYYGKSARLSLNDLTYRQTFSVDLISASF